MRYCTVWIYIHTPRKWQLCYRLCIKVSNRLWEEKLPPKNLVVSDSPEELHGRNLLFIVEYLRTANLLRSWVAWLVRPAMCGRKAKCLCVCVCVFEGQLVCLPARPLRVNVMCRSAGRSATAKSNGSVSAGRSRMSFCFFHLRVSCNNNSNNNNNKNTKRRASHFCVGTF